MDTDVHPLGVEGGLRGVWRYQEVHPAREEGLYPPYPPPPIGLRGKPRVRLRGAPCPGTRLEERRSPRPEHPPMGSHPPIQEEGGGRGR